MRSREQGHLVRRPPSTSPNAAWRRLKLRYKLITAVLPLATGIAVLYLLFMPIAERLAAHFGVDPNVSISAQAGSGGFIVSLFALAAGLLIGGWLVANAAVFVYVWGRFLERRIAILALLGKQYPESWYEGRIGDEG